MSWRDTMSKTSCNFSDIHPCRTCTDSHVSIYNGDKNMLFAVHIQERSNEPSHEIMVLFDLRKLILQTRMCSHPVVLDVWVLIGTFVYFRTSCVRTAKALARLRGCTGSPEPSLVAYVISTIISWAGSNEALQKLEHVESRHGFKYVIPRSEQSVYMAINWRPGKTKLKRLEKYIPQKIKTR